MRVARRHVGETKDPREITSRKGTDTAGELYFANLDGGLWKIVPVRDEGEPF